MDEPKILILVEALRPDGSFPGSKLFWSIAASVGLNQANSTLQDLHSQFLGMDNERPMDKVSGDSRHITGVLVGGKVLRQVAGLAGGIDSFRGYVLTPGDCRSAKVRKKAVVGVYATSRKGHYTKGDPKEGWVTVEERFPLPESVRYLIPCLDPESVQRDGLRTVPALKADLSRVVRSVQPAFQPIRVSFLTFPVGLGTVNGFALDIETVGEAISRIGISNGGTTWTYPWGFQAQNILQRTLDDNKGIVAGHNLAFDLRFLKRDGLEIQGPLFDTMLAAHLIQPDLYKGLGRVASLYLDVAPWKHLSGDEPERYNATDVRLTWEIAQRQAETLVKMGMASLFHGTIMPALPVLIRLTERGLKVSEEEREKFLTRLSASYRQSVEKFALMAPNVNPLSPAQVRNLLYKDLGLPVQTSYAGKETVEETALVHLRQVSPKHIDLIDLLLEIRKVVKLRGTYAEVELAADGCVHPGYLPAGKESDTGAAATGRLASSNPNIQNQPPEARNLFVPHGVEMSFLEWDYSQIELRIAAELANDSALKEALKRDVHSETQRLLGCDRVRAKNVLFGSLYGAGPRKLARILRTHGIATNEVECRELQDRLASAYPRLWGWRSEVAVLGQSERSLTNPFSRRRYFYGGSSAVPQMIDYLPQSTAADIVWDRLVPLDRFCEAHEGHLVTTVHDSFLMEFPKERIDKCLISDLRDILEIEYPNIGAGFKVPGVMKIGSSWGQMEPLPPDLALST